MEAYKVWVTLNLQGDALKKMEQFTNMTKKATAAVEKLNNMMKPRVDMFDKMAVNVRELNPALSEMARNINNISKASNRVRSGGSAGRSVGGFGGEFAAGMGLMSPAMLAGTGAALAIGGTARAGWHQNIKSSQYLGQLAAMGYSPQQMAYANQYSSQVSMGITQADKLQALVDAQMATQSFSMAKSLAPIIAQNKYTSLMYGGMSEKQVQDAIKTAEMIGGSNPAKVAQALNSVMQMTALSGGSLMPGEQRAFMRQAAGAASRLTPLGYLSLEPVMQEYGGAKTGTALTTGLRSFSNPQITNFAKYKTKRLEKLGLWDSKTNRMKKEYFDLIATDPSQFAQLWLSKLSGAGITSDSDIQSETLSDLPRTFGVLTALLIKNMDKITRERAVIAGLPAGEGMAGIYSKTQLGAQTRLSKSFESLSASIVHLASPKVTEGMNAIAAVFENLANFISKNENILKFVGKATFSSALSTLVPGGQLFNNASGLLHKGDVTAGSVKQSTITINHTTTLEGKPMAKTLTKYIGDATMSHQLVQHGPSDINTLSSPVNPGLNNLGGFG